MYRLFVLVVLLTLSACAMDGASYSRYGSSHANLCPMLGNLGATMAWPYMQQGVPVEDVLDMLDARTARTGTVAAQKTGFYTRWATQYVYYHPHWTQDQARVGVEQACLRAALR